MSGAVEEIGIPRAVAAMAAMVSLYFFSFFLRTAIPGTLFNELQTDLALSAEQVTALGSVFLYIYATMQLVIGVAADRWGGARVLLVGGFFMAIGAATFPFCRSFSECVVSRAFTGFGASFMYLCIIKEVDSLFGHRRFPTALGVSLCFGYAGGIAAMLPFERVVATFGWRPSLHGVSVTIVVLWCLALVVLGRTRQYQRPVVSFSLRPLWAVLANRRCRPLLLVSLINYPTYFVMQAVIGKKFLQDYAGLSSASGATFTMVMMGISAGLMLTAGPLLRLTGQRRKPHLWGTGLLLFAGSGLMWLGVWYEAGAAWFLACYVLLASSTLSAPAGNATMKELSAPDAVGTAISVYNAMAYGGVAILTHLSGVVLDWYSAQTTVVAGAIHYPPAAYGTLFGILALMSIGSLLITFFIPETSPQKIAEPDPK